MPRHRHALPQLADGLFLTDGGLETTLVFHDGLELPCFAAYVLLETAEGRRRLADYMRRYAALARRHGLGLVIEAATWRANRDWGRRIGHGEEALAALNRVALELFAEVREELGDGPPLVLSGCVGPRGDGYRAGERMDVDAARAYHAAQLEALAASPADLASALTMTGVEEAAGFALAARDAGLPAVVSFTVETDGRLPDGTALGDAVRAVDAATEAAPAYYMVNCAHPTHFAGALEAGDEGWIGRLRGLRANASARSHAELDAAEALDDGDPEALGHELAAARARRPRINVLGGCCGTDERHIDAVARAARARA